MRSTIGSVIALTKLYRVPSWLVVVVVVGVCPMLFGGWLAQRSGNWGIFERSGSITAAIGLVVASRRYFQYGVHELAGLHADDQLKSDMAHLMEDVLMAKEGLALSAFGTFVSGWGRDLRWWSFSFLLVWAWFVVRDIRRDSIRLNKRHLGATAPDTSAGR